MHVITQVDRSPKVKYFKKFGTAFNFRKTELSLPGCHPYAKMLIERVPTTTIRVSFTFLKDIIFYTITAQLNKTLA